VSHQATYCAGELVGEFLGKQRCHESIGYMTPADKYFGLATQIQSRHDQTKEMTMQARRRLNRQQLETLLT
jgi:hypothetical protein